VSDRRLLSRGLDTLGIRVADEVPERLSVYCSELLKWNRKINLIARNTSPDECIEKHFLDSLTLLPIIDSQGERSVTLLDVGTGAGFPGLVLAAVRPGLTVTLVEPRQKRITFLLHIIRTLELTNVRLIGERLEQADLDGQEFTFITGRAVADVDHFLAMIIPVVRPDTQVITMTATDDSNQWTNGTRAKNWQLVEQRKFQLPFSSASRVVSVVKRYPLNI
jgi:16S rRNA (guanine527-N7)-methyltransferase